MKLRGKLICFWDTLGQAEIDLPDDSPDGRVIKLCLEICRIGYLNKEDFDIAGRLLGEPKGKEGRCIKCDSVVQKEGCPVCGGKQYYEPKQESNYPQPNPMGVDFSTHGKAGESRPKEESKYWCRYCTEHNCDTCNIVPQAKPSGYTPIKEYLLKPKEPKEIELIDISSGPNDRTFCLKINELCEKVNTLSQKEG